MKPWRCRSCGAQLGKVARNGRGIRQMLMYRKAVDTNKQEAADVEVIAVVEGYVADVRCSVCGSTRTWVPGQEALTRLLKSMDIDLDLDTIKERRGSYGL